MKVLLLSPFFFPEQIATGKYNTYLAETLALAGYDVTVVASHPIYPDWRAEISNATLSNIEIKRGGNWIIYPRSAVLRRVILEIWYTWYIATSYFRLGSRPDIVISIFPPSLFFMLVNLLIPYAACRIGIVHDLQGVYAARSNSILKTILNNAIHFVEKLCFSACDRLIFLSESMANRAIAEYQLVRERCCVCYPFVTTSADDKSSTSLADVLLPDILNVVYSGALGEKQNPDGLFEFMNNLANEHTDIACHIFSGGPIFDRLRLSNQSTDNCKVQFHELVSGEQLAELYARSSVQIIPQAVNTSEGSLPSKLPNLLATGVPIFVICDPGSELGDLVNEAQAGVVAHTWDIAELAGLFRTHRNKLVMESKSDRRKRLKTFVKSKFSIDYVVENVLAATKKKQESL